MRRISSTRSFDRRLPPEPPFYSGRWTGLYTARTDGSDVRLINDSGMVSHFDWRDDRTILAWARTKNGDAHFHLIDALTGQDHAIAE